MHILINNSARKERSSCVCDANVIVHKSKLLVQVICNEIGALLIQLDQNINICRSKVVNCRQTLDFYLLFAILLGQIKSSKLNYRLVINVQTRQSISYRYVNQF